MHKFEVKISLQPCAVHFRRESGHYGVIVVKQLNKLLWHDAVSPNFGDSERAVILPPLVDVELRLLLLVHDWQFVFDFNESLGLHEQLLLDRDSVCNTGRVNH